MNVTPEVMNWLKKADNDLAAAYWLAENEQPFPDQIGFFCQQSAEKYLKAFIVAFGQTPPRIHDIDALLDICATVNADFDKLHSKVLGLTEFAVIFRYPDEWSDEITASHALEQTESIKLLVYQKLNLTL